MRIEEYVTIWRSSFRLSEGIPIFNDEIQFMIPLTNPLSIRLINLAPLSTT